MNKNIVVDFDDTLSFTVNRDWENASPNLPLINRLNRLHREGWVVEIYTARGSISCATREEADKKSRPVIEAWLLKHGVSYDLLSFHKPFAQYYIDDKGFKPGDFLKLDIRNLESGLSGAEISTDGTTVFKEDKNHAQTLEWYKAAEDLDIRVPTIGSFIGSTISMEYIKHDPTFGLHSFDRALGMIMETLNFFDTQFPINDFTYGHYVQRILSHVSKTPALGQFNIIKQLLLIKVPPNTFAHGDFGITNMLFNKENNTMTLIDPINASYSSVILDAAKFIGSLHLNPSLVSPGQFGAITNYIAESFEYPVLDFKILIAAELSRVCKYHPTPSDIIGLIKNVLR